MKAPFHFVPKPVTLPLIQALPPRRGTAQKANPKTIPVVDRQYLLVRIQDQGNLFLSNCCLLSAGPLLQDHFDKSR